MAKTSGVYLRGFEFRNQRCAPVEDRFDITNCCVSFAIKMVRSSKHLCDEKTRLAHAVE